MKFFLTILTLLPLLGICQDITKVHSNVAKYLSKHLNNPGSYKSVSWGKPEKVYIEYSELPTAKKLENQIALYENANTDYDNKMYNLKANFQQSSSFNRDSIYDEALKQKNVNVKIIDSLTQLNLRLKSKFKPVFSHYYIEHTFRARNSYNALMLNSYVFYLNKNLVVTSMDTESLDSQMQKSNEERQKILNEIELLKNKYRQ